MPPYNSILLSRCVFCKCFLPLCDLSSDSLDVVFAEQFFQFFLKEITLSIISIWNVSLVLYLKSHHHSHLGCLQCYGLEVLYFCVLLSKIHFELIFVKNVRFMSRFIFLFLHKDVPLFQHHSSKRPSLPHCIAFDRRSGDILLSFLFYSTVFFFSCVFACTTLS